MVTPRQMGVLGVLSGIVSFGSIAQADGASPASWTASAERPPTVEVVSPASAPMEFAASELARY
ncbi:MAG: hypothetical protein HY321_10080, partial [Armatimonadetes bacterium]|nr:hypothetical protein [Armatimonadota bacterium]